MPSSKYKYLITGHFVANNRSGINLSVNLNIVTDYSHLEIIRIAEPSLWDSIDENISYYFTTSVPLTKITSIY